MRDPKERLSDTLQAIAAIVRHLDRGRAEFESNELLHGCFVGNQQIIGEVARERATTSEGFLASSLKAMPTMRGFSRCLGQGK